MLFRRLKKCVILTPTSTPLLAMRLPACGSSTRYMSTSSSSDKELQTMYAGILPRVISILSLYGTNEQAEYSKLLTAGVLSSDSVLRSLLLYADANNPLLKKYGFDLVDFSLGCKVAFLKVSQAISSADLFNFSNGFSSLSTSDELLRNTVHPKIYRACREACTDIHENGVQFTMLENKVLSLSVLSVTTEIIEKSRLQEANEFREKIIQDALNPPSSSSSADDHQKLLLKVDEGVLESVKRTTPIEDLPDEPIYPEGSVVASVDVSFRSFEKYERRIKGGEDTILERESTSLWTFKGCISGHSDLEWIVVKV